MTRHCLQQDPYELTELSGPQRKYPSPPKWYGRSFLVRRRKCCGSPKALFYSFEYPALRVLKFASFSTILRFPCRPVPLPMRIAFTVPVRWRASSLRTVTVPRLHGETIRGTPPVARPISNTQMTFALCIEKRNIRMFSST